VVSYVIVSGCGMISIRTGSKGKAGRSHKVFQKNFEAVELDPVILDGIK